MIVTIEVVNLEEFPWHHALLADGAKRSHVKRS